MLSVVVSLYYLIQVSHTEIQNHLIYGIVICDFLHLKVFFNIKIHFVSSDIEVFHSTFLFRCRMRKGMCKQQSIHRDQEHLHRVLISELSSRMYYCLVTCSVVVAESSLKYHKEVVSFL